MFTYQNSIKEKIQKTFALPPQNINSEEKHDLTNKGLNMILTENNCIKLLNELKLIFLEDYKNIDKENERIINTMSLINAIITFMPTKSTFIKSIIQNVINIAKDKLDLLRKNAAILLAKIAKSSDEMEKFVRDLHGIEVIMNVAKFINIDK